MFSKERYRSFGAMGGLLIGILAMWAAGLGGVIAGAIFGAGGCVVGAIAAEKYYDWKNQPGS